MGPLAVLIDPKGLHLYGDVHGNAQNAHFVPAFSCVLF